MASRQLERVLARMNSIPKAVRTSLKPTLDKSAAELISLQKQFAPKDEHNLEDSIGSEPGDHDLAVRVTAGDESTIVDGYQYAIGQEFGVPDRMQANPYFRPAYRLLRKRILLRMKRAIRKVTREHWGSSTV